MIIIKKLLILLISVILLITGCASGNMDENVIIQEEQSSFTDSSEESSVIEEDQNSVVNSFEEDEDTDLEISEESVKIPQYTDVMPDLTPEEEQVDAFIADPSQHIDIINGPILENIGNLSNLEDLYIFCTGVELPESITRLKNLTSLKIYSSELETLPEDIGNLTNLETIYIDCKLVTEIPESFKKLTNLKWIIFHNRDTTLLAKEMLGLN